MTIHSKVFMEFFEKADCSDIVHTGSCTKSGAYQLYRFFLSNAKYYAPIIVLPALAKFRDLNGRVLKSTLRYYIESVLSGTAVGWTLMMFACLFRFILGRFKYYTFLFVPGILSAFNVYLTSPRVQQLQMTSVFQCTLESFLLRRGNVVTRAITNSKFLQALMLMSTSSIILQAKQTGFFKGFWLLTPDKKPNTCKTVDHDAVSNTKICAHEEESCIQHLIKGLRSYFAFGITLDFLKALISGVPKGTTGFLNKLLAKLRNIQFNSTALLASYMGIYRATYCFLNRKKNGYASLNHIIAGFLSGICYLFMPKLQWLSYASVITTQILWQYFKSKNAAKAKESTFWNVLLSTPYSKIFFPLCLGHLIHSFCFGYKGISNFSQIVIGNTTDFYAQNIFARLRNIDKFLSSTQ